MSSLVLKLILTPALIGAASLAGRRWGPALSGWLVGLPFTSGPITFFLALGHGTNFAAAAAAGTLAGTVSQAAFCLAYGWLAMGTRAPYGWLVALVAGAFAFGAVTVVLQGVALPLVLLVMLVVAALLAALRLMPSDHAAALPAKTAAPPRWDLPLRMAVATAFVLLLTTAAPSLGPRLTGLLAPFPLYGAVLAVFAQQQQGTGGAVRVLRGLLLGLFAFAGFFLTLALLLVPSGIAAAFVAAGVLALVLQAASLRVLRGDTHTRAAAS
ncbi:MAG: hypothetical protein ACHQ4H_03680 [Ktedonobacterales bacterium]